MDEEVAGMNGRRQDVVQGNRLVASDRNQGIRRIRRACLNVVGEPGIESGRSHDRRQRRQIAALVLLATASCATIVCELVPVSVTLVLQTPPELTVVVPSAVVTPL